MKTSESQVRQNVERQLMLIGGEWVGSADGEFIPVETPSRRGAVIAEVPRGNAADVDRAVQAAARAFDTWKRIAPRERGKLMLRMADAIEAQAEEIARITALDTGNALRR